VLFFAGVERVSTIHSLPFFRCPRSARASAWSGVQSETMTSAVSYANWWSPCAFAADAASQSLSAQVFAIAATRAS
jgi:hypothetical protein